MFPQICLCLLVQFPWLPMETEDQLLNVNIYKLCLCKVYTAAMYCYQLDWLGGGQLVRLAHAVSSRFWSKIRSPA